MKGHRIPYSAAELAFVKRRRTLPCRELYARFMGAFQRHDVTHDALKALCSRKGWKTGRDGCFPKGVVPANKGKKMPYNARSAATQFKKGYRGGKARLLYKPIGTERSSKEGYIERKIHDGLPLQSRWRAVHIVNWEALHGAIPKGHCLKSLDGTKTNTDAANWELIPRSLLPSLGARSRRPYDAAPAELKPTILALAKLQHGIRRKARGKGKTA